MKHPTIVNAMTTLMTNTITATIQTNIRKCMSTQRSFNPVTSTTTQTNRQLPTKVFTTQTEKRPPYYKRVMQSPLKHLGPIVGIAAVCYLLK